MKIIEGVEHYNAAEIANLIGVESRIIYYLIRKDQVWGKDSAIDIMPKPKLINKTNYYTEDDALMIMEILEEVKDNKFKEAYFKVKEKKALEII